MSTKYIDARYYQHCHRIHEKKDLGVEEAIEHTGTDLFNSFRANPVHLQTNVFTIVNLADHHQQIYYVHQLTLATIRDKVKRINGYGVQGRVEDLVLKSSDGKIFDPEN